MKVNELIERLKEYPPDMNVMIQGYEDFEYFNITKIEVKKLVMSDKGNGYDDEDYDGEEVETLTITYI